VDALECLKKVVDHHPDHPLWMRAAMRLSNVLFKSMSNPEGARDVLLKVREVVSDPAWSEEVDRQLEMVDAAIAETV
jgi:hypothetical protein